MSGRRCPQSPRRARRSLSSSSPSRRGKLRACAALRRSTRSPSSSDSTMPAGATGRWSSERGGRHGSGCGRARPEARGARVHLQRRDRRRLDGAWLQPRCIARLRHGRGRPAGACGVPNRIHADALRGIGLLLAEPKRSRLRNELRLDDAGIRALGRVHRRLGDHRGGRHRDGEPRADRRDLHVPARRREKASRRAPSGSRSSAWFGSRS